MWRQIRPEIADKLTKSSTVQKIQLREEDFERVGNRKSYSFNLEFEDGVVVNNIGGSAVARDLAAVLTESEEIREVLNDGWFKINMNRDFLLHIQRLD